MGRGEEEERQNHVFSESVLKWGRRIYWWSSSTWKKKIIDLIAARLRLLKLESFDIILNGDKNTHRKRGVRERQTDRETTAEDEEGGGVYDWIIK